MNITLVTDQFYQNNHGTSVSAQRFYNGLIERGHNVKVLTIDNNNHSQYALKEKSFGKVINKILNSQGFQLADPDEEVIRKCIEGSDIVHVYMPFRLGYHTIEICREMNIPCVAGFHILPENITSTIYLNKVKPVNESLWLKFYSQTYRYLNNIHCPSLMVAQQLVEHGFNANLHVISNGYDEAFHRLENIEKPDEFKDKFVIAFVGRFSREKRYDLIIKAVEQSKYADKIQLVFGGKGPIKNQIMKMSKSLPNYPVFDFFTREGVCNLFNYADLYIHPADIEVEGMTCVEAIACGCVPIVSDSAKSATSQFVFSKSHNTFKHGDSKDLARKIDYWFEHQKLIKSLRPKIAKFAQRFSIDVSMDFYLKMYERAIADWNKDYDGRNKNHVKPKIINYYKNLRIK